MPVPAEQRARRNSPSSGVWAIPGEPLCDPPAGLSRELLEQWHDFWSTPTAGGVTVSSLPALVRLFRLRDRAAKAHDDYDAEPLLTGSQGQQVLNPLGRHAVELDKEIRQLEDRFGLTPQALLRLNVTLADAVEATERTAAAVERAELTREQRADPRLTNPASAPTHLRPAGGAVDGAEPGPR